MEPDIACFLNGQPANVAVVGATYLVTFPENTMLNFNSKGVPNDILDLKDTLPSYVIGLTLYYWVKVDPNFLHGPEKFLKS